MATLISPIGPDKEVHPQSANDGFTLEELYALLACDTVQVVRLRDGRMMYMDEDGKFKKTNTLNRKATALLREAGGRPLDFVVGKVLIVSRGEIR